MSKFKGKYRIESTRLQNWDYTNPGCYFVTICTRSKQPWFGEIVHSSMHLSRIGEIAQLFWQDIPSHLTNTELDEYVVMPNHVHGILLLSETRPSPVVETQHAASLQKTATKRKFGPSQPGSLSTIIRSYKSAVTRWAHEHGYHDFDWQARFYDHIMRDAPSIHSICQYIRENPLKWELDENNPGKTIKRWSIINSHCSCSRPTSTPVRVYSNWYIIKTVPRVRAG